MERKSLEILYNGLSANIKELIALACCNNPLSRVYLCQMITHIFLIDLATYFSYPTCDGHAPFWQRGAQQRRGPARSSSGIGYDWLRPRRTKYREMHE